ncbi:ANTAR domain-containing protein [Rhodococcus sp. Eu-32]|uniref:ANTAR domain-containing protein n=1 Tax=Rhodococcus sp. Eu-32 TaxID=1017319 RepID=UPI000DF28678|nr:ANTAR domain-containing protein [Rhodococcus sp. Eu-32]RRQ25288.1 ANTAR domain-containing protein [Rhodococcus sp. Eu-32]
MGWGDRDRRDRLWHRVAHAAAARPGIECIDAVAVVAADSLPMPGCEVVITARADPGSSPMNAHIIAATATWAADLDALQSAAGEGPSLSALRSGVPGVAVDARALAGQWPGLAAMTPHDYDGAIFAFPVGSHASPFATLTAYLRRPAASTPGIADLGMEVAAIAALVLSEHLSDYVHRIETDTDGDGVAIAVGILAARHHLAASDAGALLRATAFGRGQRPREVADDIIAGCCDPTDT